MEQNERIIVLNEADERLTSEDISWACAPCPADCGCENAWNTCFIGD